MLIAGFITYFKGEYIICTVCFAWALGSMRFTSGEEGILKKLTGKKFFKNLEKDEKPEEP